MGQIDQFKIIRIWKDRVQKYPRKNNTQNVNICSQLTLDID